MLKHISYHGLQEAAQDVHFDLDTHLNKIIPPSPLWRLPIPIAHFLGYRRKPPPEVGNVLIAFFALLGSFVGLITVAAVGKYSGWIAAHHPPVLIASLGAAAILEYNAMLSPLAQPRNSIFGHAVAAFVGVCFAQLMLLSSDDSTAPAKLSWILAPLACGTASALMTLLNCVYPPGGATAVLAVADPTVRALGWYLILLVLIYSLLLLACACAVNNILRRYPVFWWTPLECGQIYRRWRNSDVEKLSPTKQDMSSLESGSTPSIAVNDEATDYGIAQIAAARIANGSQQSDQTSVLFCTNGIVQLPNNVRLSESERAVLSNVFARLQANRHHICAPALTSTESNVSKETEPP